MTFADEICYPFVAAILQVMKDFQDLLQMGFTPTSASPCTTNMATDGFKRLKVIKKERGHFFIYPNKKHEDKGLAEVFWS